MEPDINRILQEAAAKPSKPLAMETLIHRANISRLRRIMVISTIILSVAIAVIGVGIGYRSRPPTTKAKLNVVGGPTDSTTVQPTSWPTPSAIPAGTPECPVTDLGVTDCQLARQHGDFG